jgi:hypothetical protein
MDRGGVDADNGSTVLVLCWSIFLSTSIPIFDLGELFWSSLNAEIGTPAR